MGPSIFIMYSAPLEDVIKSHGINYISYVDDTQLVCTFHHDKRAETISKLEHCLNDVKAWTHGDRLKLNDAKTEVVHVTSRFVKTDPIKNVVMGETDIAPPDEVRNLGVTFDNQLSMLSHINNA